MRPNTAPKFQDKPLTAEVHRKMILSFEECTSLPERELKCPYCSHYIEGVFSEDFRDYLAVVITRSCTADEDWEEC